MSPENKVYDDKMLKTIEVVKSNFASVRAGRANAGVLDRIMVEYYGTPTPLNQVAAVSSPDPRTLVIQPWDATLLRAIEKAIQTSDLGINPQNDGRVIRLAFPQLTEERRKELGKQVRKYGEEGKVAVRNIRRDAMEDFKKMKKNAEFKWSLLHTNDMESWHPALRMEKEYYMSDYDEDKYPLLLRLLYRLPYFYMHFNQRVVKLHISEKFDRQSQK